LMAGFPAATAAAAGEEFDPLSSCILMPVLGVMIAAGGGSWMEIMVRSVVVVVGECSQ
jgi:hypothetical protein